MTTTKMLIEIFQRNSQIIGRQVDGLTHADTLLQLPFRGNCLNWVLGHIIVYRDVVLELVGGAPVLTNAETAAYLRGAEPLTKGDGAVQVVRLLTALDEAQTLLLATLERTGADALGVPSGDSAGRTVGERLAFLAWHESYHVGQLEILRQLAGVDDAVIS